MSNPTDPATLLAELMAKKDSLQTDVNSLSELRDQLALSLLTMEQNTDRITTWLKTSRESIIVTRHQLMRAIDKKDAATIKQLLADAASNADLKDVIGFLLTDGDIAAAAAKKFGDKHAQVAALQSHVKGLPARLIESAPEISVSDDLSKSITKMQSSLDGDAAAIKPPAAPVQKGGILSGWFKNQTVRDAEDAEKAYHGMLDHWRQVQRGLIGLQSDRHYYIDSFMDWVGENLSPSNPDQDFAAIMVQYRHPVYVIERAREDYAHALGGRTRALLDDAATYSSVAGMLDRQDISAFIADLPKLFPRPDLPAAGEMRRLLLADFKAQSFADIALDHVKDPADQLKLLDASIAFEGKLKINGAVKANSVFPRILSEVCKAENPLPVAALTSTLRALESYDSNMDLRAIVLDNDTLTKLTERFGDDDIAYTAALTATVKGFGSSIDTTAVNNFVTLRRAALERDAGALASAMSQIGTVEAADNTRVLWDLVMRGASNTGISLTQLISDVTAGSPKTYVPLLAQAINLGLAREMMIEGISASHDGAAFGTTANIVNHLINAQRISDVSPAAITLILAASRIAKKEDAIDSWRSVLDNSYGVLRIVAGNAELDADKKARFIAALLSPITSEFEKTAILERVSADIEARGDLTAANVLRDCARGLMGDAYPVDTNRLLVNPENVANMWFDAGTGGNGTLFYTVGGKTQVMAQRMHVSDAENLMTILAHRHDFMVEKMGLFNPALADGFEHTASGQSRIIWDMHEAPLNIDANTRHALTNLDGMIHADSTDNRGAISHYSMRPSAVLALLPMATSGQWLIVDRNGNHQIVNNLRMPTDTSALLRVGNAFINPARASLLSLDNDSQSLSLRVENPVFTQLVEAMAQQDVLADFSADGQYIRVSATSKKEWQACVDTIDNNPLQLSPGGDLAHLRFNLDTLGFVTAYAEAKSAGIQYSHKDKGGVSGRIEVDADLVPELMRGLAAAAAKNSNLLVVPANGRLSDLVVNLDHAHNVFYQPKDAELIVVSDVNNLRPGMSASAASPLLRQVAGRPGWQKIDNRSQAPDLMRMDRATLLHWDKDGGVANVTIGNRAVQLGMTKGDFDQFIAQKRSEAMTSVTGALTRKNLEDFAAACTKGGISPDSLPGPRRNTNARDMFAKVSTPSKTSKSAYEVERMTKEDAMNKKMTKSNSYKKYKY